MLWLFLSLGTAFLQALKDLFLKGGAAQIPGLVMAWLYCLSCALFLTPLAVLSGVPPLGPGFFGALAAGSSAGAVSFAIYVFALRKADLGLALPMLTFTPLFMLATSPLMIGEFPRLFGVAGIVLIVAGSYVMGLGQGARGALGPFRALLTQPGARLMLLVAFVWSLTSNIDRIGINHSAPIFWITSAMWGTSLLLAPAALKTGKGHWGRVWAARGRFALIGLFEAASMALQMTAVSLSLVSYVIAVKRLSAVFGVLLGAFVLKEGALRHRLIGSAFMVAGVMCIAFLG